MKRPAFQLYPGDWLKNLKLRRCSWQARGAWIEVLCLLHGSDEYGLLRWPLEEIAQAIGCPMKTMNELVEKEVFKGADHGCRPYVFTPTHAGRKGAPITLVAVSDQPCWYSSRMVRDEYVRSKRGESTRFGEEESLTSRSPMGGIGEPPKGGIGDGSSSSTSSSKNINTYAPQFEDSWRAYPPQNNPNKKQAYRAWNARINLGERPEVMHAGVLRYAEKCRIDRTEPRFVKNAATFFGPDQHYLTDWKPTGKPAATGRQSNIDNYAQQAAAARNHDNGNPGERDITPEVEQAE